ncbi:DNA methylase [Candidatus Magnetomorum sp. HK-1]|nr:DNA methylase [Candidatus Magnetomorum sp. HK-1]
MIQKKHYDVRETTVNVGLKIEQALRKIEKANQEFLYGIFGDAQWSNKNKLSDKLLIDLIEHFSQYFLGNENVNPDMLGQAYEYLIKHFADLRKVRGRILIINLMQR